MLCRRPWFPSGKYPCNVNITEKSVNVFFKFQGHGVEGRRIEEKKRKKNSKQNLNFLNFHLSTFKSPRLYKIHQTKIFAKQDGSIFPFDRVKNSKKSQTIEAQKYRRNLPKKIKRKNISSVMDIHSETFQERFSYYLIVRTATAHT